MHTLAIDPGTKTGFAHSRGIHGVWDFRGYKHPGGPAWALIKTICELHASDPFDAIITEGSYPISRVGADRLEWMRGAVQIAAHRLGSIPVRVVAPSSLKLYAVGHGDAPKTLVMRACIDRLGIVPQDDNHSDAIWLLHLARVNKPAERISLPAKPRKKKAGKPRLPTKSGKVSQEDFPF